MGRECILFCAHTNQHTLNQPFENSRVCVLMKCVSPLFISPKKTISAKKGMILESSQLRNVLVIFYFVLAF